jgi:uncharacterized protein
MSQSRIEYSRIDNLELNPGAISSDWIIAGDPKVRSALISQTADGEAFTVVWECSEGTFRWNYTCDETIHFIEGSVTFDDGSGVLRCVGPGDVVYFPKGSSVIWNVKTPVRKLAICRKVLPGPLGASIRYLRLLKSKLRGSGGDAGLLVGAEAKTGFVPEQGTQGAR